MKIWNDIRHWRRARRDERLHHRRAMPIDDRLRLGAEVAALIEAHVPDLARHTVGFYWPIKGEIDLRRLVGEYVRGGADAALPVVVEKRRPVEFWQWAPGANMRLGDWRIPVPVDRNLVHPTALLVPLLGFDSSGFRLGYGVGYYDRTLAAMAEKPLAIGVGYEDARLETIFPQPHDIPMDAIVTEAGFQWFNRPCADENFAGAAAAASSV